ncbi:MAG: sodium/solute symporter, partial [Planctomycetaceae bacterium]|nr:sodium/solute symporter [Planctomycetaceae bacterium]
MGRTLRPSLIPARTPTNSLNCFPMHPLDFAVVALYLLLMLGLGFAFGRHQTRREFFAASGSMGWLPVGLSVMATLFSSNSFVFYPSAAFGDSLRIGLSLVAFALMTPVVIWVFIPVYARLKVETAYEYLELRFHVSVRTLASGLFVLLRIGWMASATYAASVVVSSVMGVPQTAVIVGLGIVSIGYTMLGGLRAVMWTDVIQFFVFAITILATLWLILDLTGSGVSDIIHTCFDGREGLIIDFSPSMTLRYGSWVILIGVFLEALSAFGVDQVAVQRYLSAKSERSSQWGAALNLAAMWIVLPGLLMIGVGLYAYFTQNPAELGGGTLPEILAGDTEVADRAMPDFVRLHFPPGLAGLFLAALMAAIMSSIDSGVHSVTTALVVDFRDRLLPQLRPKDEYDEVAWIRVLVVIIGTIAITLACFVGPLGNVFDIGKKLTAAFGGPLLAIFILALFSRRTTWLAVLVSVSLATALTLYLMYTEDWFSVWFWPIGFGTALVFGYFA